MKKAILFEEKKTKLDSFPFLLSFIPKWSYKFISLLFIQLFAITFSLSFFLWICHSHLDLRHLWVRPCPIWGRSLRGQSFTLLHKTQKKDKKSIQGRPWALFFSGKNINKCNQFLDEIKHLDSDKKELIFFFCSSSPYISY